MIKRIFSIILTLIMVMALVTGCGAEETKKPSKKPSSSQSGNKLEDEVVVTSSVIETTTPNIIYGNTQNTFEPTYSGEDENMCYQPDGAPVTLKVEDFGAKGDGKTDDAKAIYNAMVTLANSPRGSVLVFGKNKTYYYKDNGTSLRAVIYFSNNENLTVKGDNTLILLGGDSNYYADVTNSKNITIEGLSFDYKEYKAAFAATVERGNVDADAGTAIVKIDREIFMENGETAAPRCNEFGVVPSDSSRHHMYLKKYEMIDKANGIIKVYFDTSNGMTMSRLKNDYIYQYGFVLPSPYAGKIERGFSIHENENFTMRNVNIYSTSRHVFSLQWNEGNFIFENVNVVRAPYDQNLRYVSWADCYHLIHNRAKFVWKNCKNEWNYDDVFNISTTTHYVSKVYSNKEFVMQPVGTISGGDYPRVGETISIINTKTGAFIGRATVRSVISQKDGYITRVKVNEELPLLQDGEHIKCWVDNAAAPGSEFINCNFDGTFRARSELTFTNCTFNNRRFWIGLDTIDYEGPIGKNVIFRNCKFTGDNAWEVFSGNSNKGGYKLENIVFENCTNVDKSIVTAGPYDEIIFK